jgi:hypothetical protein
MCKNGFVPSYCELVQVFERLMCEVEFWEVFLRNVHRFFNVDLMFHMLTAE